MSLTARLQRPALAGLTMLSVGCMVVLHAQAASCIDTNSDGSLARRTMAVQQSGMGEIAITGAIVSLNPATGEIGVKALGIDGEQRIRPTVIRLATLEPNMAAQMPLPIRTPLGPFSAEFPFAELTIDRGFIRYPNCAMAADGHEIAFTGTLTFDDGKLKVDGFFVEYEWPAAGGGGPGIVGGKRG